MDDLKTSSLGKHKEGKNLSGILNTLNKSGMDKLINLILILTYTTGLDK